MASQAFDCVLLDYRLPDVDTFELLAALLTSGGAGQAILILTGEADQEIAFRMMREGALDYLTKGEVTPASLARAIRYATARREFLAAIKTARQDAEEKSLALDALNRQKNLLFSIFAHDLRNPLQAMLGMSELLGDAVALNNLSLAGERARGIEDAIIQANQMMNSLFAWASLQMDTIAVALTDVDLNDIVDETVAQTLLAARDKGLTLHAAHSDMRVRAHAGMLTAVLRNLVSNGIKFTRPGGTITIAAHRLNEGVEVSVADTGIGMAPERAADLFKLDRRHTTAGTAGERGSGLGLLLCRDLVVRQGGDLVVQSMIGCGTTFSFRLPSVI